MPMKDITIPQELIRHLQNLSGLKQLQNLGGGYNVDPQRHALLESLKQISRPTNTEQSLIDEITLAEATAMASNEQTQERRHKEICELYEKVRQCVKDMFLGKYLRITYGDGQRHYLHVRGVTMYNLGARVCISGTEFIFVNLGGFVQHHVGTEYQLFRCDEMTKPSINVLDALNRELQPYEYIEYDEIMNVLKMRQKEVEHEYATLIEKATQMADEDMFIDRPANAENWW